MSVKHTQGRLTVKGSRIYEQGAIIDCIATMQVSNQPFWDEDARRLAACWNACDGLDTALLENILTLGDTLKDRFAQRDQVEKELRAQHDELRKARQVLGTERLLLEVEREELLKHLQACVEHMEWSTDQGRAACEAAVAAIQKFQPTTAVQPTANKS